MNKEQRTNGKVLSSDARRARDNRKLLPAICHLLCGLSLITPLFLAGCRSKELTTAKVHIQQNNWEKAIVQLERAVAADAQNFEAQFLLGQGYANQGRFAEMNSAFAASLAASSKFEAEIKQLQQKYFADHFNESLKAIRENDLEAAQASLATARLIDPSQPETYRNLALVNARLGQFDEALNFYLALLEIKPDDLQAYVGMAGLHNQRQEYHKSVEVLEQALTKHPNQPALLAELAAAYDFLGEGEKACKTYQLALRIKPDDKTLLLSFGRWYLLNGNYWQAIEQFAKVLSFHPDDFEANYNTGLSYLKIGERLNREARDSEKQAPVYLDHHTRNDSTPKPQPADLEVSRFRLTAHENFKTAVPYLQKAVELDPNHAGAWFNLGVGYTRLGDTEKAKEAFHKSEELQACKEPTGK